MSWLDRRMWLGVGIAACVALGAVNFAVDASAQSLFVDDAYSWNAAQQGVSGLMSAVRNVEVAPPTYYLTLHAWIHGVAGQSEVALRTPSIVIAALLVLAVALLAGLLGGRRAALVAAGLTALSPLVIQYGQQARAYIFAALASTLAVAAAIKAARQGSRAWCLATALASIVAVWFHYTSLLVVASVLGWLLRQSGIPLGRRLLVTLGVVAAVAPLIPLASHQLGLGHAGVAAFAFFNARNLASVLAGPFSGRYTSVWPEYIGAVVMVAAFIGLWRIPGRPPPARGLLLSVCLVPVVSVVVLTLLGQDVLISRYVVVAVPTMIVVVALVVAAGRRLESVLVGGAAVLLVGVGTVLSHLRSSFPAPLRPAVAFIVAHERPSDVITDLTGHGLGTVVYYYLVRDHRTDLGIIGTNQTRQYAHSGHRVWLVSSALPVTPAVVQRFRYFGLALGLHRTYTAAQPISITLTWVRSDARRVASLKLAG